MGKILGHEFDMRLTASLLLAVAAAHPAVIFAAVQETRLPPVTVEASEERAFYDGVPSQSASFYGPKDLGIAHELSINKVLEGTPGVAGTQAGGAGQLGLLYLRGVGGQGLITLDGMPFPDSMPGIVNLDALLPDGLGSVDVIRGFGPAARAFPGLGGGIALRSREAESTTARAWVEGGTFGTLRETLRSDFAGDQARLAVTVNRTDQFDGTFQAQESRGNPERDPLHATQAMMNAGLALTPDVEWQGSMLYRKSRVGLDQIVRAPSGLLDIVDQSDNFFNEESWMAQNTLKLRLTPDWDSRLQMGFTRTRNSAFPSHIFLAHAADLYLARWENTQRLWSSGDSNSVHLIWGAEGRHERGEAPASLFTPAFSQERNMQAGFLDLRFRQGDLSGDLGVRPQSYDRFEDHTLFHAGAAWQAASTLKLRANGGNGFRVPSYGDLLFPLLGNRNIRPERGGGGDLGFEWRPASAVKLDVTGFYSRYHDLAIYQWHSAPTARFPCIGHCIRNLPNSRIAGAETELELRPGEQWRTGISYTYTDSRDLDGGGELPFRPRHSGRVWGEWRLRTLPVTLWGEAVYRGRYWNDVERVIPGGDAVHVNLLAKYQVSPELEVYVRGENLNNDRTPQHVFFDYPGAAVYGGVQLKLF